VIAYTDLLVLLFTRRIQYAISFFVLLLVVEAVRVMDRRMIYTKKYPWVNLENTPISTKYPSSSSTIDHFYYNSTYQFVQGKALSLSLSPSHCWEARDLQPFRLLVPHHLQLVLFRLAFHWNSRTIGLKNYRQNWVLLKTIAFFFISRGPKVVQERLQIVDRGLRIGLLQILWLKTTSALPSLPFVPLQLSFVGPDLFDIFFATTQPAVLTVLPRL
jgi:hypothetical protein